MRLIAQATLALLLLSSPAFASVEVAPDAGPSSAPVVAADGGPADATAAPAVPTTAKEAADGINIFVAAAKGGHWSLALGILLTLLVWFLDRILKLKDRVGSKALPWVAAGLGIMATMGISLASGLPLGEGLVQGFMTGATAVGLWELLYKHVMPKKSEESA